MQYFSGRFKEAASDLILDFHSSIHFDKRLYRYDIMGSIAHVRGLSKMNIISKKDGDLIEKNLIEILEDIENGNVVFTRTFEDIHMNIEKILIDRIGDVGKKLHTGRSRNDQVTLDMKLFAKDEVKKIQSYLLELIETTSELGTKNLKTYMPGFTHLQKAQPITFGHYMFAYSEMFKRDFKRLENAFELMDYSPLGSAALAGTTYPIDREFTANILGFKGPTLNSLDGVSDRDYLIEIMSALSIVMMHLSRFSEEIIIYSSNDYGYIELSDSFSTGSSIMPQKKNPDAAELVRGKTGRVYGDLIALLTTMKGIPLAYNKDMQEDKEAFFDAVDTVKGCLQVFIGMVKTLKVKGEVLLLSCNDGFINATDVADYLTTRGISFREAYKITGQIVAYCIEYNLNLETLSLNKYKEFSYIFNADIYETIAIETCVQKRKSLGGPSKESLISHLEELNIFIEKAKINLINYKLNDIL
ncbi:MAG: argininosuccinate lyase [Fusobacteriaceae bacterium]